MTVNGVWKLVKIAGQKLARICHLRDGRVVPCVIRFGVSAGSLGRIDGNIELIGIFR